MLKTSSNFSMTLVQHSYAVRLNTLLLSSCCGLSPEGMMKDVALPCIQDAHNLEGETNV